MRAYVQADTLASQRSISSHPRVEQRDDRRALVGEQAMLRARARAVVFEATGLAR